MYEDKSFVLQMKLELSTQPQRYDQDDVIKRITPELLYNGLSVLDHSQQVWTYIVGYYNYDG